MVISPVVVAPTSTKIWPISKAHLRILLLVWLPPAEAGLGLGMGPGIGEGVSEGVGLGDSLAIV